MIKKIFFALFLLLISLGISYLLILDFPVILNINNYELSTDSRFLIFALAILFSFVYLTFFIITTLFYPNIKKYKKRLVKLEKKYDDYINLITKALIYLHIDDNQRSSEELKSARRLFRDNNLNYLLESDIYYNEKKYIESEETFFKITDLNLNKEILDLKIKLNEAVKNKDDKKTQEYALKIIELEPTNKLSIKELLRIYIDENDWINSEKILQLGLKSKIFTTTKSRGIIVFVLTALGKCYYDNNEFFKAKKPLRQAYKTYSKNLATNILLAKTYAALDKKLKAIDLIKKSWSYETNPKLAEIYFSLFSKKDANKLSTIEKLYKKNTKSFDSNYLMAKYYLKHEMFIKARQYAKIAENIEESSDIYELMLEIEKNDCGSSAIVANLKNKILNSKKRSWRCTICKRKYVNWEPRCMNCGFHDCIIWE